MAEAKHFGKVEQQQRKILEESVAAAEEGGPDDGKNGPQSSIDFALHRKDLISSLFIHENLEALHADEPLGRHCAVLGKYKYSGRYEYLWAN